MVQWWYAKEGRTHFICKWCVGKVLRDVIKYAKLINILFELLETLIKITLNIFHPYKHAMAICKRR